MEQRVEPENQPSLRRLLIVVAAIALLWAYVVAITGGFIIHVGLVRFSSRAPRNALLLAIALCVSAWLVDHKADWRRRWTADAKWLSAFAMRALPRRLRRDTTPSAVAGLVAGITVLGGVVFGAHVAAASDSYGYVSQAHSWATGQLEISQPLLNDLPPNVPQEALVPLGYRLNADRNALVPTYAPGLPMLMSAFERLSGRKAVFLVVPILAGLAVWATYMFGRALLGDVGGCIACIFIAASPAFVFQLLTPPMSDIAVTAWWTTALFLATRRGRVSAFGAGLATAAAILTRPNLVPLAIPVAAILFAASKSPYNRVAAAQRVAWFAAPAVLSCLFIAYLNTRWYGSPLSSGYGTLAGVLFRPGYFWPNLANYTSWILDSQGPLSLLTLVGLLAFWRMPCPGGERIIGKFSLGFAACVYACYAFYLPLQDWWSLRFMFPAFPVFFTLITAGGLAIVDRLSRDWRSMGVALFMTAVTGYAFTFSHSRGVFHQESELRYEIVGHYIDDHLPPRAVFLSMLHSGSVRYYSGRLTVRYDIIPSQQLEVTLAHLRQRGYVPFFLIDDDESAAFRSRFADSPIVKALDAPDVRLATVSLYRLSGNGVPKS